MAPFWVTPQLLSTAVRKRETHPLNPDLATTAVRFWTKDSVHRSLKPDIKPEVFLVLLSFCSWFLVWAPFAWISGSALTEPPVHLSFVLKVLYRILVRAHLVLCPSTQLSMDIIGSSRQLAHQRRFVGSPHGHRTFLHYNGFNCF